LRAENADLQKQLREEKSHGRFLDLLSDDQLESGIFNCQSSLFPEVNSMDVEDTYLYNQLFVSMIYRSHVFICLIKTNDCNFTIDVLPASQPEPHPVTKSVDMKTTGQE